MIKLLVMIWSLMAVICKLLEVGTFASLEIIDWPWRWSCLCIMEWWAIVFVLLFIPAFILEYKKQKAKAIFRRRY